MASYRRKQITFDLHTGKMKELGVYSTGYSIIRKELEKQGFQHLEKSVYVSKEAMPKLQALNCFVKIGDKYNWLDKCLNGLSITSARKDHESTRAYFEARAIQAGKKSKQKETTQEETKQPTHADQLLWVLENCRERIAEDIAANRSRQVGQVQQVQQVQQVRQVGQGKSEAARKTRSK